MKLVFITRKIDRGDALTGFIFTWISKLAQRLDQLFVICQEKGDISGLPGNVEVHSFGKEKGYGKFRQGYELLVMSYEFGRKADGFFVHMHPIYAIIVSAAAKLLRRKLVLWYAHGTVDLKLKLATRLVDRIVSSSPQGFRYQTGKVSFIGQAIDTVLFAPAGQKQQGSVFKILSLGRISPVKRLDLLIAALALYKKQSPDANFSLAIAGQPGLPEHQYLLPQLKQQARDSGIEQELSFIGPVAHSQTAKFYQSYDLLVNLSETGSLDKVVLEAMAAGCLVLTSNEAYQNLLPVYARVIPEPSVIASRIRELALAKPELLQQYQRELRQIVVEYHSLEQFAGKLLSVYEI